MLTFTKVYYLSYGEYRSLISDMEEMLRDDIKYADPDLFRKDKYELEKYIRNFLEGYFQILIEAGGVEGIVFYDEDGELKEIYTKEYFADYIMENKYDTISYIIDEYKEELGYYDEDDYEDGSDISDSNNYNEIIDDEI